MMMSTAGAPTPGAQDPRVRDQLYCIQLAAQAMDDYFDCTWDQLEPMLESTWENGDHAMSWCEARWFVKCAWTDCLNRGAADKDGLRAAASL
jgi:hypothetical protein